MYSNWFWHNLYHLDSKVWHSLVSYFSAKMPGGMNPYRLLIASWSYHLMPWAMLKLSCLEVWHFFLWHMQCHGWADRGTGVCVTNGYLTIFDCHLNNIVYCYLSFLCLSIFVKHKVFVPSVSFSAVGGGWELCIIIHQSCQETCRVVRPCRLKMVRSTLARRCRAALDFTHKRNHKWQWNLVCMSRIIMHRIQIIKGSLEVLTSDYTESCR